MPRLDKNAVAEPDLDERLDELAEINAAILRVLARIDRRLAAMDGRREWRRAG